MYIIGINSDMYISSACLLHNGRIIAACAEERLTRQKMTRVFPHKAIEFCLNEAGITSAQVDAYATSWNPAVYFQKFNPIFSGQRRHLVESLYSIPDNIMQLYGRPKAEYTHEEIAGEFGKTSIYHITHHRAHAANGFYLSPFEKAAIFTSDAQGEIETTTFCLGQGNKIELLNAINYPHSLGALYSSFTEFLGCRPNSDEWKVMAMASYGTANNSYYKTLKEELISFPDESSMELNLTYFNGFLHDQPNQYTQKLVDLLGPARQADEALTTKHYEIAAGLQQLSEEAAVHMLNGLFKQTKEKNLVLSGGFFMNSVLNGKITELTPFENVFISSCPDDSGNCFGAAYYLYHQILNHKRTISPMTHNSFGPSFSDEEIEKVLKSHKVSYQKIPHVEQVAAKQLVEGEIIGWFQGKMEFGQRALGNRSILADPRKQSTKDKVNLAIKYREAYRPFAPAVLQEKQDEYFEVGSRGDVLFMEKVYRVRQEIQDKIQAVVHTDGSGRIQTVKKETSPLYYALIEAFEKETGIPIVLNTSFNLNGEPIVCFPQDALRTFFACGMDSLFLGNYWIQKGK